MNLSPELPEHVTKMRHVYMATMAANKLRVFFGETVWLAGSRLDSARTPRDWDFRICLPDDVFAYRYVGSLGMGDPFEAAVRWLKNFKSADFNDSVWRWGDDMVHHSRKATLETGEMVDVQVYPALYWREFDGLPRVRLDTRPA
jgi:hypothetical protein